MAEEVGRKRVAIVGAGLVGAALSVELTARGHHVTLIDPEPIGGQHAPSYGNGAFISPASIIPMSYPGLWRALPKYLLDPLGPVTMRWRLLLEARALSWLWRFWRAGATPARFRRTASDLTLLLADAPARHMALAQRIGRPDLISQTGLIYAFKDRAAAEGEALSWQIRRDHGVRLRDLDRADLAKMVPDLSPHYTFGILIKDGAHCKSPSDYLQAMVAAAVSQGAEVIPDRVEDILHDGRMVTGLRLGGRVLKADHVVIAAGVRSGDLAARCGDKVPLLAERGYHVEIEGLMGTPAIPVMPQDGKMANTATLRGLRAAGQVEITYPDAAPNWARADILLEHLRRSYPGLDLDSHRVAKWCGDRPSTPDGRPVIGPSSQVGGVYYAFGHGHIGLATAPATALRIADMIEGNTPPERENPFSPKRF